MFKRNVTKPLIQLCVILTSVCALAACGQKGPLQPAPMPEKNEQQQQQPQQPSNANESVKL
ncbi:hypothetical protein BFR57_11280 [Idiomarina sp. MD25a]|uniref:LPS translocon maturation chaperone LptM n=1 Tax=Idiomarina sp. MD25a TaxID=1889913 RepID=UPI0008F8A858|nr:lipoprotein [Idiomarina sp. MD25a]OIN03258.1 hypothetical protein BFR57_11280 [Idiomarina sp. MD25a]